MMQPEIDDIHHPLMQLTTALLTDVGRISHNKFIIDDPENIEQAVAAGIHVTQVFFYGEHAERYPEFLQNLPKSTQLFPIRPRTAKKIFGVEKLARVYAIADIPQSLSVTALNADLAVLDGLMMTGNIGAIMRSALAFTIGGIVLLNLNYHALYDRRLIRASKGYVFKLPLVCMASQDFFNYCKQQKITLVNCSPHATMTIAEVTTRAERLAFILGAEKHGVSTEAEKLADLQVKIPYNTEVESLNVSVAAAIIFYSRFLTQKN